MNKLFKMLLAGAVAMVPMTGLAAIDSTHHDMTYYLDTTGTDEKCAYCHSVQVTGTPTGLGSVGAFCAVRCHTTLATAVIEGPGYMNPANFGATLPATLPTGAGVLSGSHGLGLDIGGGETYESEMIANAFDDSADDVVATGWPHTNNKATNMQCTSCHAVHDSTNPPFLNAPLATGNNTTAFCQQCHEGTTAINEATARAGRYGVIGTPGAHPTEFTVQADGTASLDGGNASAQTRVLDFDAAVTKKQAAATTKAGLLALVESDSGNAWVTGGHFMNATEGVPSTTSTGATFGCYTCHSAHQSEAGYANSLLLGTIKYDINGDGATSGYTSSICISCHGSDTDVNNPGALANYTHPANEDARLPYVHDHSRHSGVGDANLPTSGTFPIDVSATLITDLSGISLAYLGGPSEGTSGDILCVTCHDVHGGVDGMMAIRNVDGSRTAAAGLCRGCHGSASSVSQNGVNWHHPTTATGAVTTEFDGAAVGAFTTDMDDGLQCHDCHVFNDTAHNW